MQVVVLTPDQLTQIITDAVCNGISQAMQAIPPPMDEEKYLTVSEAAAILKCSVRNIYTMLNDGVLTKHCLNGKTLLLKKEVLNAPKKA